MSLWPEEVWIDFYAHYDDVQSETKEAQKIGAWEKMISQSYKALVGSDI